MRWKIIEVEPKWNVNAPDAQPFPCGFSIEVEPKWNVNAVLEITPIEGTSIEVEPKWNVNSDNRHNIQTPPSD